MNQNRSFLQKLNKSKTKNQIKKWLFEASSKEILLLYHLIIAFFDPDQGPIPLPRKKYNTIEKSKKLGFLNSHFASIKKVHSITEAKRNLLKIANIIKIFVSTVVA